MPSLLYTCLRSWLDGAALPDDFNYSFLALIPKSDADAVSASDTRPLSLGNTDAKLFAASVLSMFIPGLSDFISEEQSGFMPGRDILHNVLATDDAMKRAALQSRDGGACFFDFAAAFPSISHDFLWRALAAAGVPARIVSRIQSLYSANSHWLKWQRSKSPLFSVGSGVKQGCPLSPTLYIVVTECVLRFLKSRLSSDDHISGYADDLAIVMRHLWRTAPALAEAFAHVARFSGLRVHPGPGP